MNSSGGYWPYLSGRCTIPSPRDPPMLHSNSPDVTLISPWTVGTGGSTPQVTCILTWVCNWWVRIIRLWWISFYRLYLSVNCYNPSCGTYLHVVSKNLNLPANLTIVKKQNIMVRGHLVAVFLLSVLSHTLGQHVRNQQIMHKEIKSPCKDLKGCRVTFSTL